MEEEEKNSSKKLKIILASGSPRRKSILGQLKVDFDIIEPSGVIENVSGNPYKTVIANSDLKTQFAFNRVKINSSNLNNTVIAAFDTIIYMHGRYFGKPEDVSQAESYLKVFSGKYHSVITGISLMDVFSGVIKKGFEVTKVRFRKLGANEIKNYLERESVTDKAGAYDINGYGCILIEKIEGCFYNVAGLPVSRFLNLLNELGYSIL